MTGKTQKERREIRKQQQIEVQKVSCPICLENIVKQNQIQLECGHISCNNCWTECTKSEINKKINSHSLGILAPIGLINDAIPLMVFINEEPIVRCGICRTAYMSITKDLKPQKILIKV